MREQGSEKEDNRGQRSKTIAPNDEIRFGLWSLVGRRGYPARRADSLHQQDPRMRQSNGNIDVGK